MFFYSNFMSFTILFYVVVCSSNFLNLFLSLFSKHFYVNCCGGLYCILFCFNLFFFSSLNNYFRLCEVLMDRTTISWHFNFITIACNLIFELMNDHPLLFLLIFYTQNIETINKKWHIQNAENKVKHIRWTLFSQ